LRRRPTTNKMAHTWAVYYTVPCGRINTHTHTHTHTHTTHGTHDTHRSSTNLGVVDVPEPLHFVVDGEHEVLRRHDRLHDVVECVGRPRARCAHRLARVVHVSTTRHDQQHDTTRCGLPEWTPREWERPRWRSGRGGTARARRAPPLAASPLRPGARPA